MALLLLGGCKGKSEERPAVAAAAPQPPTADEVRAELLKSNFGRAAELAATAAQASPQDSAIQLLHAQAEARLGNGANAARAFEQAVAAGLEAPAKALADPAFDTVRQDPAFRQITARFAPRTARSRASGDQTIRAGDVEIGGDTIRAGDIVLEDAR